MARVRSYASSFLEGVLLGLAGGAWLAAACFYILLEHPGPDARPAQLLLAFLLYVVPLILVAWKGVSWIREKNAGRHNPSSPERD